MTNTKMILLPIYFLSQVNGAFDFFEGFRDSSKSWQQSSNAANDCPLVQAWLEESNETSRKNVQELELDHGKHFSGTGVEDVGLYAKHNEAIYLQYHEFTN